MVKVIGHLYGANSRLHLIKHVKGVVPKSVDCQSYALGNNKVLSCDLKKDMSSGSFKADGK